MMPEGWVSKPVSELFELQLGKMLNKEATKTTPRYPYLGNREVQWGRFDLSDLREMHFSEGERKKFVLRYGDLLVCEGGEVGRSALWRGTFECYFQKALHRLRPITDRATSEYMLHFMRFAADTGRLTDYTSQSSIAHLTREKLAQIEVLLPPLPEQRKIAAILSSVDDAIEATQAVIDQLQVVKKAMMAELLTRGLPGRHTRFKQTEIGEVPEGWPMPRFEEITFRITYGFTNPMPTTESGPWMVTAANVRDGWIDWDSVRHTDADAYRDLITDKSRPTINDVLITKDGTLGRVALLDRDNVCMNQSVASLRPIPQKVLPAFLAWSMRGPQMQERIIGDAGGSTIKHIYISKLAKTPVPIPPMAEQLELVSILENVEARMRLEEATSRALTTLKSALSSALLTGEIRVKPDEATP